MNLGISSHKLLIETGRYDNKPRDELYFILFFLGPVQTSIFSCTLLIHLAPWFYPNDISSTVDSDVERNIKMS